MGDDHDRTMGHRQMALDEQSRFDKEILPGLESSKDFSEHYLIFESLTSQKTNKAAKIKSPTPPSTARKGSSPNSTRISKLPKNENLPIAPMTIKSRSRRS